MRAAQQGKDDRAGLRDYVRYNKHTHTHKYKRKYFAKSFEMFCVGRPGSYDVSVWSIFVVFRFLSLPPLRNTP